MKNKRISWYQTGIISLLGLYFLGNMAIDKEIARTDLRGFQLNMPDLSTEDGESKFFSLAYLNLIKKKPQIKISIDSLAIMATIIKGIQTRKDESRALTIFWNDNTHYQKIINLLDTLNLLEQKRYGIIPNEKIMLVDFYFPKGETFNGGSCLPDFDFKEYQRMQEESKKTTFQKFEDSYNLLFKNYLPMWLLFSVLSICVIWKIRQY